MRLFLSLPRLTSLALLCSTAMLHGQVQRPGVANQNYAQHCASCHGDKLQGGLAPSMLDDTWAYGGDDANIAKSIRDGIPAKGMPPWKHLLNEQDIRSMVIFIREQRDRFRQGQTELPRPADAVTVKSQLHSFQLNTWVKGLNDPWALAFLTSDRALVTEKGGRLFEIKEGRLVPEPIKGLPSIDTGGQAGLFEVIAHPDYAKNGWIYLAFADLQTNAEGKKVSLTRIIRGKLKDGSFVEQEDIFKAPLEQYPGSGGVHFGGRIAFDGKGYLFFTIGERGNRDNSQDLTVPMGKVHRVFDDGRVPDDNPFAKQPGAARTIWSYGHRNPQGLAFNLNGDLYDVEHGPRGGDEVNLVRPSLNYGWPVITYGMEYDGRPITAITEKEGMEQPVTYWVPSIAASGATVYKGDLFPKWKNHLFVASLAAEDLRRVEVQGEKYITQELLFKGVGRMRSVTEGPDGALYVVFRDRIGRITPAE